MKSKTLNTNLLETIKPGLTVITGAPYTGKTRLKYHIASCLTQNKPLFGVRKVNKQIPTCLILAYENDVSAKNSLQKCKRDIGLDSGYLETDLQWGKSPEDRLHRLKSYLQRNWKVVIVDSIEEVLGADIYNTKSRLDSTLAELRKLAVDNGVSLLINQHFEAMTLSKQKSLLNAITKKADQAWFLENIGSYEQTTHFKLTTRGRVCGEQITYLSVEEGSYSITASEHKPTPLTADEIGERVKLGLDRGLNQVEIATMMGVNQSTVSRVIKRLAKGESDPRLKDVKAFKPKKTSTELKSGKVDQSHQQTNERSCDSIRPHSFAIRPRWPRSPIYSTGVWIKIP